MGFIASIERRASIENPSTSLANPALWLTDALGVSTSSAGVRVNPDKALSVSAIYAAMRVLANVIAVPSLPVYERLQRGRQRADHYLTPILDVEPNPEMSALNFKRTLQRHLPMYGQAFAERELDNSGRDVALWPLLPDRTRAVRINGRKAIITTVNGRDILLPTERVLHIVGENSWDGLNGRGFVQYAAESIGLSLAMERFGASFFGRGSAPSGVLMHQKQLSTEAQKRLKDQWHAQNAGLTNSQRTLILEEGMTWQQTTIAPEHAQFIEGRKFSVTEVSRWTGVAPHLIYDLERATYSNIEQQQIAQFVMGSLPWYRTWEQELNRQLIPASQRARFYFEFLHEELLRADSAARAQFYKELFMMAALSPNDIREKENMNPIDGGDAYFVPVNMMTLEVAQSSFVTATGGRMVKVVEATPVQPAEPRALPDAKQMREYRARRSLGQRFQIQMSQRRVIAAAAERIVTMEVNAVTRLAKKHLDQRSVPEFRKEVAKFYEGMSEKIRTAFFPTFLAFMELVASEVAAELDQDVGLTAALRAFVTTYVSRLTKQHVGRSLGQINRVLAENVDAEQDAVLARMDEWSAKRARKIGAGESSRASGAFARTAYAALGVQQLIWHAAGAENCPWCSEMNGRVVGIQEVFLGKGEAVGPESDSLKATRSVLHPPIHTGCVCMISAV
jgi:HK97 family phage portal protein